MRIITISREFGSGGRELGKRLAEMLEFDYYDKEIISAIAEKHGLDEKYVEQSLENHEWRNYAFTFRHSFCSSNMQTNLLVEQKCVIENIARTGNDCVIVGRNADVLLHDYYPLNIFVCADMKSKIRRCAERSTENELLSDRQIEQNIKRIDKSRRQTREILTDSKWGDRSSYHLIVNTSDWNIKELTPAVADFAKAFFGRSAK